MTTEQQQLEPKQRKPRKPMEGPYKTRTYKFILDSLEQNKDSGLTTTDLINSYSCQRKDSNGQGLYVRHIISRALRLLLERGLVTREKFFLTKKDRVHPNQTKVNWYFLYKIVN